jgi:hypothetical protein
MPTAYLTVADATAWLGLPGQDRDDEVLAAIKAASALISRYCNADLGLQQTTEVLFGLGSDLIFPRRGPLVAVVSIAPEKGSNIAGRVSGNAIKASEGGWFARGAEYTVTYTAGYATLPEDLLLAARITTAGVFNASAYDPNLANESLGGVISGSFAGDGPGSLPPAARALLNPLRQVVPF